MEVPNPILDILSHSGDIRDQIRKLCKIGPNFARFWRAKFFRGGPPEFLDMHYKVVSYIDHVAKFRGDRPRELGDPMAD